MREQVDDGEDHDPHDVAHRATTWTHADLCFDPEWNALETCAGPAAWEFDAVAWDEGPKVRDALRRVVEARGTASDLKPRAAEVLSRIIDGLFD